MYSAPNPTFAKDTVLRTLPPNLKSWWNVRNDDILTFRWGDPDYVRSYVMNLPPAYHWHDWDYMWHVETCSGYDPETSGLNYCKRFYTVYDFIDNRTMEGSGLMTISDYTSAVAGGEEPRGGTPIEYADLMLDYAKLALEELSGVGG